MENIKICMKCNSWVSGSASFCPHCGASEFRGMSPDEAALLQAGKTAEGHSMKWFKFLIYFSLFCSALLNFVVGIFYVTGIIYDIQSNGQVTSAIVYLVYPGLKIVDVIFGVILIIFAGFAIYTRFRLVGYRSDGPMCLSVLYAIDAGMVIFYNLLVFAVSGAFDASCITSAVTSVVFIVLNYIYFKKRKDLFVN